MFFFSEAKFMILLCRFVVQCVRKEMNSSDKADSSVDSQGDAEEDKVHISISEVEFILHVLLVR